MSAFFDQLLAELSEKLEIPLSQDGNGACLLVMRSGLKIQLEMTNSPMRLLFSCKLGALPRGSTRLILMREALKWNCLDIPATGFITYYPPDNQLVLQHLVPMEEVNADFVFDFLDVFEQKASLWVEAVSVGYPPDLPQNPLPDERVANQGIFGGLKPFGR